MQTVKNAKRKAARLLAAALASVCCLTAAADGSSAAKSGIPDESFFVMDEAGVLSSDLESELADRAGVIYEQTGCRLIAAAVDFLGGETIEERAAALYEQNGMGDNGVLLLFSVAEENYHVLQGTALEPRLSDAKLEAMLEQEVEEAFAAGDHAAAVANMHRELTERLEEIYSVTSDRTLYELQLEAERLENERIAKTRRIYFGLFLAAAFTAVLFLLRMAISLIFRARRRRRAVRRDQRPLF